MLPITITYLNHSGFSVATGKTLLVFDYYPAEQSAPGDPGVLTGTDLARYNHVYVFVSHAHPDHFDPVIYQWHGPNVHYIISFDLPHQYKGHRMHAGETYQTGGITVESFDSTDEGISFLVTAGSYTFFHAGDLNLWHWRDESSLHDIELAEQAFYRAVKPLEGREIDVAFFPVDPRQGTYFDAGANYFAMAVKPRLMIPMHWQGRADVALDFARRNRTRRVDVRALVKRGEAMTYEKQDAQDTGETVWAHEKLSRSILQEREAQQAKQKEAEEAAEAEKARVKALEAEKESKEEEKTDEV